MSDNWQLKAVLSANAGGMLSALKQVNAMSKDTRKYLSDVVKAANNVGGKIGLPFAAVAGAMGGLSLVAVKNAVVGFTESAEEIKKGALKAGTSVEDFQRLKFAGEQAGVGVESLEMGMSKLNLQMAKAATGQAPMVASLMKTLGISIRDANGDVRSSLSVMPELADAFERNASATTRAQMGMALFGKNYADMLPMLTEGGAELSKNVAEFNRIKGPLSTSDVDAAKNLGDEFAKLSLVSKGFQGVIAKQLIPVIQPLVVGLTDWWVINKKLISSEVAAMAKNLAQSIKGIDFNALLKEANDVIKGFGRFIDFVGGAKNALIGFVLYMNIQTLTAVAGLGAAIFRLGLSFLLMAGRAYIAANASLISLARIAIVAIATAGPLGAVAAAFGWMGVAAASAGGIITGALTVVRGAISGIGAAIAANPLGIILGLASVAYLIYDNWDTLKKWFFEFFDWVGSKFQSLVKWATDLANSVKGIFSGELSNQEHVIKAAGGVDVLHTVNMANATGNAAPSADPYGNSLATNRPRPSLINQQSRGRVDGQVNININGAPQGTRVEQVASGGSMPINLNVGYSSAALGMP